MFASAGNWFARLEADEPEVSAELTPEKIFAGESVRYRVTLKNCDPSITPDLDHFLDIEVRLLGKTSGSRSKLIVNGRVITNSQSGPTYEYLLTPKRTGKINIPAARVIVDGKQYLGPVLPLEVTEPGKQDVVVLELIADPAEVYPLQPFTLKLNVAVKALPEPVGDREPLSVQQQLPQMVVPWADDENLPPGIKPETPAGEWLRGLLDTSRPPTGLAINNIRTRGNARFGGFPDLNDLLGNNGFPDSDSLFSMLQEEGRAAFHPAPQKTTRRDLKDRRVGYWEYSFDRTFIAEKLGEYSFGPASLKGMFGTRVNTRGDLEGERVYAVSQPVSILVKDAPLAGRPDDYVGAIGNFEVGAELNPTEAKVGDPMTLNVWLKGTGTLANITAPKLAANPLVAANFKVYEATDQSNGDERRFTFSLRPKQADTREFPSITMSYFDVEKEKYVSLHTNPIPITVHAADQLATADIALPAATSGAAPGPEARVEGVFANITDVSQLRDETVQPRRYAVFVSSLMGAFLVAVVVTKGMRSSKANVRGLKRKNAARRAKEQLAKQDGHSVQAISSALRGLVADWIDEPEQSLTTGEMHRHLVNRGIDPEIVKRLVELSEKCDAARYGAQSESLERMTTEAQLLIDDLVRELKKAGS